MCNHQNRLVGVDFNANGKVRYLYACKFCQNPLKTVVTEVDDFVS
jgi:hypothetical protein